VRLPPQRVKFVITNDCKCQASVAHAFCNLENSNLPGSPVDKIADEDYPTFGKALFIAKSAQELSQSICMAVDIADSFVVVRPKASPDAIQPYR